MEALNCWEVMNCGREPGGRNTADTGACPAAVNARMDGVHRGKNAGRVCWIVAGTMCGGEPSGTFASKLKDCRDCDFYHLVKKQEGENFLITMELIDRLLDRSIITESEPNV